MYSMLKKQKICIDFVSIICCIVVEILRGGRE